jgi:hypothetical protein
MGKKIISESLDRYIMDRDLSENKKTGKRTIHSAISDLKDIKEKIRKINMEGSGISDEEKRDLLSSIEAIESEIKDLIANSEKEHGAYRRSTTFIPPWIF